jgi:Transcription factor WhiB
MPDEDNAVEDLGMSFIDRMKGNGSLASGLGRRELWQLVISRAMCARGGMDPDQWYPVGSPTAVEGREAAEAIALCTACVVRMHCLELSLRYWTVGQHGVWGGTVPAERAALRRELTGRLRSTGRVLDKTEPAAHEHNETILSTGSQPGSQSGSQRR